jgi:hypothetical protein
MVSEKKCMVCGKVMPGRGAICEPCQDRIRREAMGEQASTRSQAEKELKKHGVNPGPEVKKPAEKN